MAAAGSPTRVLHRSEDLLIGLFDCAPDDALWDVDLSIGDGDHVVFPRSPVRIVQRGRDGFLATSNHAVFYRSEQEYRRSRFGTFGDHCLFIDATEDTFQGAAVDVGVMGGGRRKLPFSHGPLPARAHLARLALERALEGPGTDPDPLAIEEVALALMRMALVSAGGRRLGSDLRPRSLRTRHALVEAAKEELASPTSDALTLAELAERVHSSPHHLAHVFREATGFTLYRYRLELRLRESAAFLSRRPLADVANSAGFRTHAHFSRQFKKTFATTPSRVAAPKGADEWLDLAHECLAPA